MAGVVQYVCLPVCLSVCLINPEEKNPTKGNSQTHTTVCHVLTFRVIPVDIEPPVVVVIANGLRRPPRVHKGLAVARHQADTLTFLVRRLLQYFDFKVMKF